jgi:uncharacterized protein YacL
MKGKEINKTMFYEVLDKCIVTIIDGLEDFFNVFTYPSRKYIKTAMFIAFGFLVISLISIPFEVFVFVNWYESLAAIILLAIIYFVSDITSKQVQDTANLMMVKTTQVFNSVKGSMKASTSKSKKKKKSTRKPNKRDR